MKQSTRDKAKGTFHEVKGEVKEMVARATSNPGLELKVSTKKSAGRSKRKSAEWKKPS